jgi:hypothetical protein
MMRSVSRRIGLLEARAAAAKVDRLFLARIFLVDPEKGLTGVLRLESDKSTKSVPTPEDEEWFRTHTLSKHRRVPSEIPGDIS